MASEQMVTSTTPDLGEEATSTLPLVPKVSITHGIEGLSEEPGYTPAASAEVESKPCPVDEDMPTTAAATMAMKKQLMKLDTLHLQGGEKKKPGLSVSVPSSPGSYTAGETGQTGQICPPASPTGTLRTGRLLTRQPSGNRKGRAGSLSPNRGPKKRPGSCRYHKLSTMERAELEASIQRSPQSEYKIRDFFGDRPITDKITRRSLTIHPGGHLGADTLTKADPKSVSSTSLTLEGAIGSGPSTPSKTQKVKGFFRIKSPKSPAKGGQVAVTTTTTTKKDEMEELQPRKLSRQGAIEEDDGAVETTTPGGEGVTQGATRRGISRQRQVDNQDGDDLPSKKPSTEKTGN